MTVQIEIDEQTLAEVDAIAKDLRRSRVDVIRDSIRDYLQKQKREKHIEEQYAEAYGKSPVQPDEFEIEDEQLIEAWKDL